MEVTIIPVLADNYIFVLYDCVRNIAAVVDPAIASPVLEYLKELDAKLVAIFNTHHHSDHVGGNRELIQHFPDLCVYGGAEDRGRIPGQQVFLHTRAHIAYYFPPTNPGDTGELFCGDTMFAGGCGRLFEGTPAQMVDSLSKLRNLPDNTRIWCAHEYTLSNLKFALTVDGNNSALQDRYEAVKQAREQEKYTIPSVLSIEKQTNPFLRWDTPELQTVADVTEPARVFGRIRGMKDRF